MNSARTSTSRRRELTLAEGKASSPVTTKSGRGVISPRGYGRHFVFTSSYVFMYADNAYIMRDSSPRGLLPQRGVRWAAAKRISTGCTRCIPRVRLAACCWHAYAYVTLLSVRTQLQCTSAVNGVLPEIFSSRRVRGWEPKRRERCHSKGNASNRTIY